MLEHTHWYHSKVEFTKCWITLSLIGIIVKQTLQVLGNTFIDKYRIQAEFAKCWLSRIHQVLDYSLINRYHCEVEFNKYWITLSFIAKFTKCWPTLSLICISVRLNSASVGLHCQWSKIHQVLHCCVVDSYHSEAEFTKLCTTLSLISLTLKQNSPSVALPSLRGIVVKQNSPSVRLLSNW